MRARINRPTVDLADYPDLVVMYLGMRANSLRGVRTIISFGRHIREAVADEPEGLLHHEWIPFGFVPLHLGFRQYWRDLDALEEWARSPASQHSRWWREFLRDPAGTGFWHELYMIEGGFEGIYPEMEDPIGMMNFAPVEQARGGLFSARDRLNREGDVDTPAPITEDELYTEE